VITLYTDRCFRNFLADTINLNAATSVHDPNDPASSLTWTFTKGKHFKVDTLMSRGFGRLSKSAANSVVNPIDPIGGIILYPIYFNHHIVIDTISAADASFFGTDSIKFTVKDPAGTSVNKMIYFTRVNGFCLYHP
jgi:hypothetical protein